MYGGRWPGSRRGDEKRGGEEGGREGREGERRRGRERDKREGGDRERYNNGNDTLLLHIREMQENTSKHRIEQNEGRERVRGGWVGWGGGERRWRGGGSERNKRQKTRVFFFFYTSRFSCSSSSLFLSPPRGALSLARSLFSAHSQTCPACPQPGARCARWPRRRRERERQRR